LNEMLEWGVLYPDGKSVKITLNENNDNENGSGSI